MKSSKYTHGNNYTSFNNVFTVFRHGKNQMQCAKDLTKVKLDKTSLGNTCLSKYYNKTACDVRNLEYRSADGSCNNLKHSFWGEANTAYKRLIFPAYKDGNIFKLVLICIQTHNLHTHASSGGFRR